MGAFFKGWRRKVGCVTLVMSLCLSGAWVRSLMRQDNLHTPFLTLHAHGGTLAWFDSQNTGWQWHTKEINADNWTGFGGVWRWNKGVIAVPYWIFTFPLIVLSAYLILWKPRQAPKPAETGSVNSN
jgi:hypothetical protein